jgi:hypothetical protein
VIVNGAKMTNPFDLNEMKALIDSALAASGS